MKRTTKSFLIALASSTGIFAVGLIFGTVILGKLIMFIVLTFIVWFMIESYPR